MKKLIVLLIALCLFGCKEDNNSKLSKLGYGQKVIDTINTYPEEYQKLFLGEYNAKLVCLMEIEGFDITKAEEYLKYYGLIDNYKIVKAVNNNDDIYRIADVYLDEYFLDQYEYFYLEYLNNYPSVRECVEAVNTKTYLPYYTDVKPSDISKDYLMLINKYYGLSRDFEPSDLVDIESGYGRGQARRAVYEAYKQLQDDANELGYYFTVCSGYRDYDLQEYLYNNYLAQDEGGVASVDTYSARPGHSEHQSGLCLDLYDATYGMDDFGLSEASKWVNENCYKYGFIIRYTKEKEKVTGYQAEPWQIRYVGSSEIAKDIMDRGITFDEYYACFVEE